MRDLTFHSIPVEEFKKLPPAKEWYSKEYKYYYLVSKFRFLQKENGMTTSTDITFFSESYDVSRNDFSFVKNFTGGKE